MLIIGLTGSIGMGKSTMAKVFRDHGLAVLDADHVVHDLYAGKAAPLIETQFPGTTKDGVVDRARLSDVLARSPDAMGELEAIVHPLVQQAQARFLKSEKAKGAAAAVLEIPLLFETGGAERVDVTVVVSASKETQTKRVLERPGMTQQKLAMIRSRQWPDDEKRRLADFIVDTDRDEAHAAAQITDIIKALSDRRGEAFDEFWRHVAT